MAKAYDIEGREVIAAVKGLRTQILTIGPDQCVPWHHHSEVTDTFFCIDGPMQIETRNPDDQRVLLPGETTAVGAGQQVSHYSGRWRVRFCARRLKR